MRKVIYLIHMTLDGFIARPNGDIDWVKYDNELESYSHELHERTDTAIYGRVTYKMMESYWPTVLDDPTADEGALNHARWLDKATKIAVSTTMDNVTWKNAILIRDNLAEEITKLKQQPGKDMWLLGSPTLAQSFMRLGLIDEYRITLNPVVLGQGKPLFAGQDKELHLKLLDSNTLKSGVVILRYEPETKQQ